MDSIVLSLFLVIFAFIISIIVHLIIMATARKLNARFIVAIGILSLSKPGDNYYVYGEYNERIAARESLLFASMGLLIIAIFFFLNLSGPMGHESAAILIGAGFFFIFFLPLTYCIFLFITRNWLLSVTSKKMELWKFKKEQVSLSKTIEWNNIKRISVSRAENGSIYGKGGYRLTISVKPRGHLTTWAHWANAPLLWKDILKYAPQSLTEYCILMIKKAINEYNK